MKAESIIYLILGLLCLYYGISAAIENPDSALAPILGFGMLLFFGFAYYANEKE